MPRVASYNIHGCVGPDRVRSTERVGAVLAELGAGLIALQEVGSRGANVDADDQAKSLARTTGMDLVLGPTIRAAHGDYGNALLSAYPICELRRHDLSLPRREPRGAIDVVVDAEWTRLRVVATHLGLSLAERRSQVRRLLAIIEAGPRLPLVVLGDFNEWFSLGRPLRWLRRALGTTPAPRTYPARLPLLALDRVWARPSALLGPVRVHKTRSSRVASDHLPLVAELNRLSARSLTRGPLVSGLAG
jgi:endonuclease/exonuclease/phosphatase family metal-dependent hydrolase